MQKLNPKFVQIALFLGSINFGERLVLATEINNAIDKVFDGEPLLIPLPNDAPPEIPRILMKTKDGNLSLNIAQSRIDLIFENKTDESDKFDELYGKLVKLIMKIIHLLIGNYSTSINRLGLIANLSSNEKEYLKLMRDLINEKIVQTKDKEEMHVDLFKKEDIDEYKVNIWTRLIGQDYDKQRPMFQIVNDINIRQDETYNFNEKSIEKFFYTMQKVIEENVGTYVKHFHASTTDKK